MEGEYVVVIGIWYTYTALRYKAAFIATWWSVGLSRRRPWFDSRPRHWWIEFFSPVTILCTKVLSLLKTLKHNILITLYLYENCTRVFSTMTIQLCIKFASINALFLVTFFEPILVFVRITKRKSTTTYWLAMVFFTITYSLFHSLLWRRFSPLLKQIARLYEIQVTVIYSRAILITVTSECRVKRVIFKTWTEALANSAGPDQILQNVASDKGLHCLLRLQGVNG